MYPTQELTALAARKAGIRASIARHRAACVTAATRAAQPLARLDQLVAWARRILPLVPLLAPLLALPASLFAARAVKSRSGWLRKFFRWSPLIFGAFRAVRTLREAHEKSGSAGRRRRPS